MAIAACVAGAEVAAVGGGEHVAPFTHLAGIRARVGPFLRRHTAAQVS